MPIRHCQLCGIKVIVDDDKASVFPFYCDLCQTKTNMASSAPSAPASDPSIPDEMGMPMAPSLEDLAATPSPVTPPPPPAMTPAPRRVTPQPQPSLPATPLVKCPVCSGEIPITPATRPIKSRCPICNAELAVFPDGSIKSAHEAELLKYAKTQEINVRPPTEDLKTKIREMIQEEQRTRLTPQPVPPPPRPVAKPVIPQAPKVVVKGPTPTKPITQSNPAVKKSQTGSLPPAAPPSPPPPAITPKPVKTAVTPSVVPPPPPPPSAARPEPDMVMVESPSDDAAPMPDAPDESPSAEGFQPLADAPASTTSTKLSKESETGLLPKADTKKKVSSALPKPMHRRVPAFVSLPLLLLSPLAGVAAYYYAAPEQNPRTDAFRQLDQLGEHISKSGKKLFLTLFPPEPEKPPETGPSPSAIKKQVRTEQELKEMRDQISIDYADYLKAILNAYNEKSGIGEIDVNRSKAEEKLLLVRNEINEYKNRSGGKDPGLKDEFKEKTKQFLIDLHQFILKIEHNARKASSDIAAPMIDRANKAKLDYNKLLADYEATYGGPIMEDEKTKLEPMKASAPPDPDRDLEERINKKYAELQAAEKELKKNANPTEFDKMNIELIRQNFDQLKARYEKKFGKPFEPK